MGGKAPLYDRLRNSIVLKKLAVIRPQFSFPIQDVPDERLKETLYYLDYQGVRFISLDSNIQIEIQADWLRKVLEENENRWTIITFHLHYILLHQIVIIMKCVNYGNRYLTNLVDLVLSGHDHSYSRTGLIDAEKLKIFQQDISKPMIQKLGQFM